MIQILLNVLDHVRTSFCLELILLALPIFLILFYHFQSPLYRFPGPLVASFTNLYRLLDAWRRAPHLTLLSLHKQYGDIVRLGPNVLSFGNPDALGEIYGLKANFPKSLFYYPQQFLDPQGGKHIGSLFSVIDSKEHARMRRAVSSYFSLSALMRFEATIDSMTALFLDKTDEYFAKTGAECDLAQWLQFYAFDVVCKITWSEEMGMMRINEDREGIFGAVEKRFAYMAVIGQMPFLDRLLLKNPILTWLSKLHLIHANAPIVRFAQARLTERLIQIKEASAKANAQSTQQTTPEEAQRNDLMSLFLRSSAADPSFFDNRRVTAMCMTMANAGSDTTAISIAAVFYYLLKNPSCYRKLRAEIDSAVANRGALEEKQRGDGLGLILTSWVEVQKLPYLDACVKEAFRMHPAVGLPLERFVPAGGATILGENIPAGTIVGCNAWVVHKRREIFGEDVEVFRPERWLNDDAAASSLEQRRVMEKTLFHFGMGSRTCIGKYISLLEIYKVVPAVMRRFEVSLVDPEKEWTLYNAWFVRQRDFKVRLRARIAQEV